MKLDRHLILNGNIYGYITIYIYDKIYIFVDIFELKTYNIICDYVTKDFLNISTCIIDKLWQIYAHYEASYIDYIDYNIYEDLPECNLVCNGFISENYKFEFDDLIILQNNYIQECSICRYYNDLGDDSINIYIGSKMLKVIYNKYDIQISNIIIDMSYEFEKIIECIFQTLSVSKFDIKTYINNYYTYNTKNLNYIYTYSYFNNLKLPEYNKFKYEYNGQISKAENGEYIFLYSKAKDAE